MDINKNICLVFLLIVGYYFVTSSPPTTVCNNDLDTAKRTTNPIGDISLKIYRELITKNPDQNLIFSPVSIALALSLLERGSAGETRADLNRFLGIDEANSLNAYQSLLQQLIAAGKQEVGKNETVKLQIANAVFPDQRFPLVPAYREGIHECFESDIQTMQFVRSWEDARQKINSWVSRKTNEKIPELFKSGSITTDTAIVLANAVYLKAAWADTRFAQATLPFYKNGQENQKQESIKYFTSTRSIGYRATEHAQVIELAYAGDKLAMHIVLPKERNGLARVEQELTTGQSLTSLFGPKEERKLVALKLPKFGARSSANMNEMLKKLGLTKLFQRADLSRMFQPTTEEFKISEVVHEAFIKVNENGTEAAAATGIVVSSSRSSGGRTPIPIQFLADHPFLYGIVHKETGAILFMGRVRSIETVQE